MLLKGKNIFFTGGSRGIGHDAVIELVKHGANIAFTYVNNENAAESTLEEIKATNPDAKAKYYQLDVKDSKQVEAVAEQAISDFESINVVVNNAGNLNDNLVVYMSDEQWFDVINTHLTGTFFVCREFINEFLFNKGGKFINVSSITYTGSAGQANYSAAKAGIIGFSRALAKEWGKKNIYTNVVVPGYYDTELTRANATDIVVDNFIRMSSLKRAGKGSEYGKVIVFFASDLSSFVNGHVLEVTGGLETIPPI
ncbi:MAG: SDR family oxidoreductase [Proteobacteria bacterium]|nr:SDR family oxidoreductase [Pseudomonadota bacterium]